VNSDAPLPAAHHHRASAFFRALGTVGLTADQQQHVDALRAAEHAANAGADEATRAANAAKMRDAIIALLTPDQKMKLDSVWHRGKARGTAAAPAASPAPNN
jgi:3-hydroxyisobutyrate dehydrogenase-like beta-hydroxyacid dehydrogenase